MHLSIVIPAYNEERRIPRTLARIVYYIKKNNVDAEVIVVDDGSDDQTLALVETFTKTYDFVRIIQNSKNMGKGCAVRKGILAAKGEYILFTDADNFTPIQELKKLLQYVETGKFDIAIGSRALKESEVKIRQPLFRETMGKAFNLLVKLFLFRDFNDTQCGFKLFSRNAAQEIFSLQRFNRFFFDVEVLTIAKLHGYRIKEVAVVWVNNRQSRVHAIKDSVRMFIDIIILKYRLIKGGCY